MSRPDHRAEPRADSLAGAVLTVDLVALASNWRTLRDIAAGAECAAVVKADGYGTGLEPSGTALWQAGARTFFVAHPDEGRRLRAVLPEATIYVLNGLPPGAAPALADAVLRPVLGSLAEIEEWAGFCRGRAPLPAALHVDTGMNRLGLAAGEAETLVERGDLLTAFSPALIMSHLACADMPDHPLNRLQLERFRQFRALFPGLPASLANSAGILAGPAYHFDLVRPGIALYGAESVERRPPLAPVATLAARVIQVRDAQAGETVGYGATRSLAHDSRIAILSIGYADGYLRAAGSADWRQGASVAFSGRRAPLLGRVSMDLVAVDVTDIPRVERGEHAEMFGPTILVDEVARAAGTIGYELLTGLGSRYARHYVGGPARLAGA